MISGVTIDVNGRSETFRMTTRAMMELEDHFGQGLIEIVQSLQTGLRIGALVRILAECANNGAGVEIARAVEIADEIGLSRVGELLGDVAQAAFPEAPAEKNPKRASRSK